MGTYSVDETKHRIDTLKDRFEFYSYGHALEILMQSFPQEWNEVLQALDSFSVSVEEIRKAGGNESPIPKKFDDVLYPRGWREIRISGDLLVKMYPRKNALRRGVFSDEPFDEKVIEGYIDGHNIDFVKNKVAFDLEMEQQGSNL